MEIPNWGWAAAGIIGTSALSFLAVRLLTKLLDWNSRLLVRVTTHEAFTPSIFDEINEWRKSKIPTTGSLSLREDWNVLDRLRAVLQANGYVRLELTNKSRKTLLNVTFCSYSGVSFVQVNNGPLVHGTADVSLPVGDLQPGRSATIHVLTSSLFALDSVRNLRRSFSISANELGRVAYQYPIPAHIGRRRSDRLLLFMFCFSAALVLLTVLSKPLARLFGIDLSS